VDRDGFDVVQSWAHWNKDETGFIVADRGTPGSWDRVTLRVHFHGGIEFDHPEHASAFLSGPDEVRFLSVRLAEAAMLSELCKRGWMVG
jgi:hypothetical protein